MAGDWIKIEHATPDKPEVYQMATILGLDPDHVVGSLIRIWLWADQQLHDGNARGVTKMALDRKASVTGIADALIQVGWLEEDEHGLRFVNFERHNGKSGKKRALNNRRVTDHREKEKRTGNAECNAPSVTSACTREEKNTVTNVTGGEPPSVWDLWASIAGFKNRSYLGRLIKLYGEERVSEAVASTIAKKPADPVQYITGILTPKKRGVVV